MTQTAEERDAEYGELSVLDLTKKVNEAYEQIYFHDRTDYPCAVKIGEMLNHLKPRVTKHGEWQDWVKKNCPKISYETANIYMRVAKKQLIILAEATAKNVAATDLTIAFAREVLVTPRKPKTTNTNTTSTDTTTGAGTDNSDSAGTDTASAGSSDASTDTSDSESEADESEEDGEDGAVNVELIFNKLITTYANNREDLKTLTMMLGKHLGLKVWEPMSSFTGQSEEMPRTN